eukprot:TRINITY_DN97701_c0_g1_i1.p1 TRINITY_DN97701_c0_g1~~TRINITY_DN97701_c0_g1_i1.p1  ORF type:complete len:195 (+),score=20.95 TRINITY_DN97701_c0_g1_i1:52-636(+)
MALLHGEKLASTEDNDEVAEDSYNINSAIALVAALFLSFTSSSEYISVDLYQGWPIPICQKDEDGNCESCNNMLATCERNGIAVTIFDILISLTGMFMMICVMGSVTLMFNYAEIPKARTAQYAANLGVLVKVPRVMMNLGVGCFFASAALKSMISLTPRAGCFTVTCFTLLIIMHLIFLRVTKGKMADVSHEA